MQGTTKILIWYLLGPALNFGSNYADDLERGDDPNFAVCLLTPSVYISIPLVASARYKCWRSDFETWFDEGFVDRLLHDGERRGIEVSDKSVAYFHRRMLKIQMDDCYSFEDWELAGDAEDLDLIT
jgi:hypothetical protein